MSTGEGGVYKGCVEVFWISIKNNIDNAESDDMSLEPH